MPVLLTTALFAIATVWVVAGFNAKYKHHQTTDVLKVEYSDAFEYMPQSTLHSTQALANLVSQHRMDPPVLLNGPGIAALTEQRGDRREYSFDLPEATTATFHLFYWPQWQFTIDGDPASTSPDSLGRMTALIPAGKHHAIIEREGDVSETIGRWVSLAMLTVMLTIMGLNARKQLS